MWLDRARSVASCQRPAQYARIGSCIELSCAGGVLQVVETLGPAVLDGIIVADARRSSQKLSVDAFWAVSMLSCHVQWKRLFLRRRYMRQLARAAARAPAGLTPWISHRARGLPVACVALGRLPAS